MPMSRIWNWISLIAAFLGAITIITTFGTNLFSQTMAIAVMTFVGGLLVMGTRILLRTVSR